MNKGFVYESDSADFKMVAVIFDEDGLVVHGQAVENRKDAEDFIRKALADLRDVEGFAAPR
jgi:hypothetical protein